MVIKIIIYLVIIYLCDSQMCFKKKSNVHLELSGTQWFFEVFSPSQIGGSPLEIVTRPVVDQVDYQG